MSFKDSPKYPKKQSITVVGAGLAGAECALQLADMGYSVILYEMRGQTMTPAHKTPNFAELVCSNSFGSQSEGSAPAQLKWEAAKLNSYVLRAAQQSQVPSGQALGVDRQVFSELLTSWIHHHPSIEVRRELIENIDNLPRPAVIATGPLTHESLAKSLQSHFGETFLYFFDAIAPIVDADTINGEIAWKADRYGKGSADYWNCPLNKEQYFAFVEEISKARKVEPKDFEKTPYFEGCMPIEALVERGPLTLRFGPMKSIGLEDPKTGRIPFAAVQLRQDNKEATAFNMVGFQTKMAYPEQQRIFRMIPGLETAEFLKLGSMHRNLFINSPRCLNSNLSSKKDSLLFLAGQITGVEGYFESTCIGLLVAHFLNQKLKGLPTMIPPRHTALGSLLESITDPSREAHFQPTNINFGLFPPLEEYETIGVRDKKIKKELQIDKAKKRLIQWEQDKFSHPFKNKNPGLL